MPANRTPGGFTGSGDPRINRAGPVGKLPIGFAKMLRAGLKDGEELRDFALAVLRADISQLRPFISKDIANEVKGLPKVQARLLVASVPTLTERIEMWKQLKAAAYGKDLPFMADEGEELPVLDGKELFASIVDLADDSELRVMQEAILARQRAEGAQQ